VTSRFRSDSPRPADYPALPHEYLTIGQGGVFRSPTVIQTVLGSCVVVAMHCPRTRFGGSFHSLLPRAGKHIPHADRYRFVDSAVCALLAEFKEAGSRPRGLEIKIFGGGSPLGVGRAATGQGNAETALEVLTILGLKPAAVSVGGNVGRKIFFRTDTGEILQKKFQIQHIKQKEF